MRWQLIIATKHPSMAGREEEVRVALERPEQIRQSRTDASVLLFYRNERPHRWTCVVVKRIADDDAFVITAYPTDAIKEGVAIWTR